MSTILDINNLNDLNPEEGFYDLCCWFHERTPYPNCRARFVRHLVEKNAVPQKMFEEYRDDASEEIRELVAA